MTTPTRRVNPVVGLGVRAYGLIKRSLGLYGTTVALIQLLPAVVGLVVVLVSPTALLSSTLRRWLLFGSVVGSLAGMVLFGSRAGIGNIRKALRGERVARLTALANLARRAVVVAVAAGAMLRLHLAVVDVAFVTTYTMFTPVFDFYLGGGTWTALLFNAIAAVLMGVVMTAVVSGAPAAVFVRRERRRVRAALAVPGGPLEAMDEAVRALDSAKKAVLLARTGLIEAAQDD
jgi:hypothetical protein